MLNFSLPQLTLTFHTHVVFTGTIFLLVARVTAALQLTKVMPINLNTNTITIVYNYIVYVQNDAIAFMTIIIIKFTIL